MSNLRIPLFALAAALAGAAHAVTMNVPFSLAMGTGDRLLSVSQFDTTLGTLNSISLVFSADASNTAMVTRKAGVGSAVSYTFQPTNGFSLSTTGGSPTTLGTASGTGTFSDTLNNGHPTSAARVNDTGSQPTISLSNSLFAYFTGTGTAQMNFATTGTYSLVPANAVLSNYQFSSNLTGSLVYDYTPQAVPEPASMAALGLGAFGFLKRRKKA